MVRSIRAPSRVDSEDARAAIKKAFDDEHGLRFSHGAPDEPAELVSVRVSVIGKISKPTLPAIGAGVAEPPDYAKRESRDVVLDVATGSAVCAVFDRDLLLAGNLIAGPAIIEESASSTVLHQGDSATVSEQGHLVIEVGAR